MRSFARRTSILATTVCSRNFLAALLIVILIPTTALEAANTPCSGAKGGISGYPGETLICNDGSVSASKKSCSAYMGGAVGLIGAATE
jgi:hypothetical protein